MDTHPTRRPPILVVDDDAGIRDLLELLLSGEGYRVLVAGDGAAAFDLATAEDVDLILLDVVMPLFDAAGFCRAYRATCGTAPVVLISAAPPDVVDAAMEASGAAAAIRKPFEVDELLGIVARLAGPP